MVRRLSPDSTLIARFYLFMGATSLGFLAPVWVILLETRGLSFTEITLLDSVFFATIVLAEVPTGYIGDRLGRRNALVLSSLAIGVATAAFGFLDTFGAFLVDYVVWGVALTFRSGNDSAWLYDTLLSHDQEGSFTLVRGRGFAVLFAVSAAASLAGGFLFEVDPTYPFLATGVLNVGAAAVLLTLPEPAVQTEAEGVLTVSTAVANLRQLGRPPLRAFVAYAAVFFAVGWSINVLIQPVAIRAGLSPTQLGGLYAVLTIASAVAANYSDALERRIGIGRMLVAVPIGLGLLFFLPLALPILAVPLLFLMRMAHHGGRPMVEAHLNDRTPSLGRATVLSAYSMVVSVARIPIEIGAGIVADAVSLVAAIAGLGAVLILSALGIRLIDGPIVTDDVLRPGAPDREDPPDDPIG